MPKLIIVIGLPAAGKTTVAQYLRDNLRFPLLSKDDYKELLFDNLGAKDRAWSRSIGKAAIEILYHELEKCLQTGVSVIVDSNFKPAWDNERMGELIEVYQPEVVQVLVKAKGDVLVDRFAARTASDRHAGHCDSVTLDEIRSELLVGRATPLQIPGRLIEIETTDWERVDLQQLLAEVI